MMSNGGFSSINGFIQDPNPNPNSNPSKRKRNLPGTPDPNSEVIALSPKSLMATNRFFCEICNKGFQREQNLQLHRRGHNLPWKLKQKTNKEIMKRKVYICPEKTCVHNDPSRALGDLTGIKKHYSRKHGEKKWKCEKCSKKYAVHSDWKAHAKICGTREYKCDCGTIFSRKDSFITHRAFCDALAEENSRFRTPVPSANLNLRNGLVINGGINNLQNAGSSHFSNMFKPELGGLESGNQLNLDLQKSRIPLWLEYNPNSHPNNPMGNPTSSYAHLLASSSNSLPEMVHEMAASQNQWFDRGLKEEEKEGNRGNLYEINNSSALMSATSLLQKAAQMGSIRSSGSEIFGNSFGLMGSFPHLGSFSSNFNQGRNELFHHNLGKSDNLNELMASTSATTLTNNGDHGLLFSDINSNPLMGNSRNSSNPLIVMPNDNQSSGIRAENSLTRDFLGMGGNESRQFLQENALANFASIDSAMNLSHYSRIN